VSFRVRSGTGRYLHHNFVVALLNDLFGIQSRGGCSCAGPYAHRLLGIDADRSRAYERQVVRGHDAIRPGWVRVSLNYFISETVLSFLLDAVDFVAASGDAFLPAYDLDVTTGLWRHHGQPAGAARSLHELGYMDGELRVPWRRQSETEEVLPAYLARARELAEALGRASAQAPDRRRHALDAGVERLRWFALPQHVDRERATR
jgi:hypothetical protein